ncbi:hypothetical protein [Rubinisphaera margarita]|uniref:hypothetical protein n=1 Tax=Rubinisphaera margarita TaxID=2909586 RepID=UPI001EE91BE8|nr:hypothetical protein [Rubinisphaera margarita]MCG6154868.1 hypothetical protein [Rubinisphaera margarita]
MAHSIRLAGPWQVEPLDGLSFRDGSTDSLRVKLPRDWSEIFGENRGRARFERSFNAPTGIDQARLFLTFEELHGRVSLSLNGRTLVEHAEPVNDLRVEITELLESSNRLELTLSCVPGPGKACGLHCPVQLVIEE